MYSIFDYLKFRGDLSFKQSPLNEVDNIILTRISYMPLDKIELEEKENFFSILEKLSKIEETEFLMQDKKLCKELLKTERYRNILLSDFSKKINNEIEQQFAAITLWLSEKEIYVVYNGTDESLVGWKEDFNMSFMINVPSQLEGVKYLENIADKYKDVSIHIGGHSKGGNIAVYSGIYCSSQTKQRIIDIFSADGPGFDKEVIGTEQYKEILNKINTYIPQSSIIGRLLEHEEEYNVVKSKEKGIMQHDTYSWEVLGTKIVRAEEMTKESEFVNNVVRDWLKSTTVEQRKNFINILYEILISTQATKIGDLRINVMKNLKTIINTYKNMDEKQKREIKEMLLLFLTSAKGFIKNKPRKIEKS